MKTVAVFVCAVLIVPLVVGFSISDDNKKRGEFELRQ